MNTDQVFTNLDSEESIFFARELEAINEEVFKDDLPEFKGMMLIPVSGRVGRYDTTYTYRSMSGYGLCKIIANYSDDLPKVGVEYKEHTSKIRGLGNSYDYSFFEIGASRQANRPIDRDKAIQAREEHERLWDKLCWVGDTDFGLQGFLYDPNTTKITPTTGVGGDTWDLKTPLEIMDDLNLVANTPTILTNGVEKVTHIIMPLDKLTKIRTTKLEAGTDTTILEFFLKANPGIKIENIDYVQQLKNVDPLPSGGAGPKDLIAGYNKNARKLEFQVPQPFMQHAPQARGLTYEINCESRVGSVTIYKPLSIVIMEGI